MAITKSELVRINAALAAENEALRKQVEDLKLEVSIHKAPGYIAPQWQAERAKAMAAARDMAMRCRFVVKV